MILLDNLPGQLAADDPEQRWIISGVSWEQYEALLSQLGDSLPYRVTYLDGVLELMSPSRRHERDKTIVGSLIEAYCQETRTRYFPLGSTPFRKQEKRGGTEPDESYCIGTDKDYPDLVIEVVVTSGSINKLKLYQRLGIREVWFFKNKKFEVYPWRGEAYKKLARSEILPDLDLEILAAYTTASNPLEAALEFRQRIKENKY